jgi:DNA-directed RNA polymerase subunit RPC12/RpoP
MYKCIGCGRKVELVLAEASKIICPSCGYRIIEKERPKGPKKVMAV